MKSIRLLFLVFFTIFGKTIDAGYDYYTTYWVVDQGMCKNSYGEVYFCIHYSNCYPKRYFRNQSGETKLCGFHYDKIVMCCIEDDDFQQDDGFLDYFLQKPKFPFFAFHKNTIIRNPNKGISFWSKNFKNYHTSNDITKGCDQNMTLSIITSTESNLQVPGTTERMHTSAVGMINNRKLPQQSVRATTEAYTLVISSTTNQEKYNTTSTEETTAEYILTTPKIDNDQNTSEADYQSISSKESLIFNNQTDALSTSTQNPIVNIDDEKTLEEITTVNSKDILMSSTTNDLTDINQVISSIFISDTNAFTEEASLDQNDPDSEVNDSDSAQMQNAIEEDTTVIQGEQEQSSTATTDIDSATTTPAIVMPLRSVNTNLEGSLISENNTFGTRSLISQIERNDIQADSGDQNLSEAEMNSGINVPKYAPVLENSTSLRQCRDVYRDATRDIAWNHRSSNKALLGYGEENNIEWSCSGGLISEMFVLTAARCQYINNTNPAKFIQLGSSETSNQLVKRGMQYFTIANFILHPLYGTSQNNHYDIALVKLNTSAIYTDYVQPACLSTTPDLGAVPLWLPNDVPIHYIHISNEVCRTIYNDTENTISEQLQICAVTDSFLKCQYELGAPLIYLNTHYSFGYFPEIRGIASFGEPCFDKPAVCTKVLVYVSWIEGVVWPKG